MQLLRLSFLSSSLLTITVVTLTANEITYWQGITERLLLSSHSQVFVTAFTHWHETYRTSFNLNELRSDREECVFAPLVTQVFQAKLNQMSRTPRRAHERQTGRSSPIHVDLT